ncbi:MAG: hypothetical protein ACD_38C00119G0015 [uncultured bacterium]|uniref:THIF-type NAD/FAD binding fold domain-containing protein n=1 Tax=Candidatus Daviesbacteria bacterium GW2011_GWC2_40_12 TaxID=1618431 RepID=A0A0G0T3G8_9BACT|nr:MAG: hypothetical protein ACD_38C00119G0015 [uncultured bacterium]KKQ85549.1 MAG: hypothetical protein UT04_C0002G0021 [Candidatus Daviesbacteria bacterium GW2011_GWF2_38_7]KKR16067.1 MAG: hypothetical protein UT45_C0009G0007 [Candidatus Daviesbacteria bacterium GW2011_GWA2_39_33]KKR25475.1 MAG: hypothetical protein UT54_C0001G0024 [Candidatus Daviesbacteria bacterium GW2011_GWB1_39_5]KKR41635.1 MAG: hypothetical protein UT77_C0008G0007 [Candidatus Daviesbacteria bacterium GW2011_GWC2_40_12]
MKSLTPEEEKSQAYLDYPGKPKIFEPGKITYHGEITFGRKNILLDLKSEETGKKPKSVTIPPEKQYDLVGATLLGLNDALVRAEKGAALRDKLETVLEHYQPGDRKYGVYVYYPNSGDLVQYAPREWHRLALVTSNSTLYLDPQRQLGWEEVRAKFDNLLIAVAGASVGSNVARAIAMDVRPEKLKIGDPNLFKVSNANRVWLSYEDIIVSNARAQELLYPLGLKNKAIGTAENIHKVDPFMDIYAYFEGVDSDNLASFVGGNRVEPAADVIVEETDQPDAKMAIRLEARKHGKRVLMVSDIGSWVQGDIRPFDLEPSTSLAYDISDDELFERQKAVREKPSLETFLKFIEGWIGPEFLKSGEFGDLITGKLPKWTASMPQLGSTAGVAAGIVAEIVARSALGYKFPERFIIDKRELKVQSFGELI